MLGKSSYLHNIICKQLPLFRRHSLSENRKRVMFSRKRPASKRENFLHACYGFEFLIRAMELAHVNVKAFSNASESEMLRYYRQPSGYPYHHCQTTTHDMCVMVRVDMVRLLRMLVPTASSSARKHAGSTDGTYTHMKTGPIRIPRFEISNTHETSGRFVVVHNVQTTASNAAV